MKYFSMFAGIGGFDISLIKKGWECSGYSEIDKYAIQVYKKHFKGHKNYGNAKDIIWEQVPDFGLLVGGFPCQSFSIAGKRGGFKDTRGTLFFEIARALSVKRPKLLLLENVRGLLSHDQGKTFGTILTTLSELGYFLQWQVLNSKNFGVPQNRERVFIIGHFGKGSFRQIFPLKICNKQNGIKRIGHMKGFRRYNQIFDKSGIVEAIDSSGGGGHQPCIMKKISPCIRAEHHNTADVHFINERSKIRRLTPTECARLQGFKDDWHGDLSDTQAYKCFGNAVTVNVIEAIIGKISETL